MMMMMMKMMMESQSHCAESISSKINRVDCSPARLSLEPVCVYMCVCVSVSLSSSTDKVQNAVKHT